MKYSDYINYMKEKNNPFTELWAKAMEDSRYDQPQYLYAPYHYYADPVCKFTQEQTIIPHANPYMPNTVDWSIKNPLDAYYKRPKVKRPEGLLHPDKIDFTSISTNELWECFKLADQYNIDRMSEAERLSNGYRGFIFFSDIECGRGISELSLEELAQICSIWREDAQIAYFAVYSGEFLVMCIIEQHLDLINLLENWIANDIDPKSKEARDQYNVIANKWDKYFDEDDE